MKPVPCLFHLLQCLALFIGVCLLHGVSSAAEKAGAASVITFDVHKLTSDPNFKLNTLPTTKYGPPWADILLKPSNFLTCTNHTAIALCYYSGANSSTPCTTDGSGVSHCTCYEIPAGKPYFVDINAILNLDVYLQTVKVCGKDGHKCRANRAQAIPVCEAIKNNTLIPGAELISTFSLALEKQIPIQETTCSTPAAYAGCMTAPCKRTGKTDPTTGLPLVQCTCPNYTGPFQVGTQILAEQCSPGDNLIWSAGYTPGQIKVMPSSK